MIGFPFIVLGFALFVLFAVLLFRNGSLEGVLILVFGALALAAFLRLHFYLLLLVGLSFYTFLGLALLWAWISSSRVRIEREVKDEAMVGENVPVRYKVRSRAILPLYHTRVWDRIYRERADSSSEELSFVEPGYIGFLRIMPGETSEGSQHFVPPVRGEVKFGPVAIEGGDPFGIFTLTKWLPVGDECLVLPGWVRLSAMPSVPARLGIREQEHLVAKEGHSHEFLGTRPWTEGDSLRGVHWPLTARHGALIVRQFQREVEEEMIIILDADRRGDVGEGAENAMEYLITLALSLANAAYEMGRPWSLVIAGEKIVTISHHAKSALPEAQYILARLQAKKDRPIEEVLDDVRRDFRNAACVLLTPRTDSVPAEVLGHGDARMGGEIRSLVIRVDPGSFAMTIDDGLKTRKLRRETAKIPTRRSTDKMLPVTEVTINRGDNLADLFLGRSFA